MLTIGIDPHKQTHTAVAVNELGVPVAQRAVAVRRVGFEQLLEWGRQHEGERSWVIEDVRHVSGSLERFLLDHGETVVRLAPQLMAGARQGIRERGKSDPIDALAIARAALREGLDTLPCARLTGPELEVFDRGLRDFAVVFAGDERLLPLAAIVIASGYSTVAAVKSALVLSVGQRRFSHGSKTGSDGVAMGAGVSQIKSQLNTNSYARYSFGCAPVWGCHPRCRAAAAGFANLAEPAVGCGGWWSGWASATIARVGFPPPRKLMPEGERRVAIVSLALVGVGLISVVRLLVTGNRPARN